MNLLDRWLIGIWIIITIGAAFSLFASFFIVLLIITVIGIPLAMLLTVLPGSWIYFTFTIVLYAPLRFFLRNISPCALLVVAAIPSLAAGWLIPMQANSITEERVAAIVARDHGEPPQLPRGVSIAYAIDRGLGSPETCWDTCQRLLFSQTATSFVALPLDMVPRLASLPSPAHRFSLGPIQLKCDHSRLQAAYASEREAGGIHPPPYLWDKLPELARQGLCVRDEPVQDARADVLVLEQWNYDPGGRTFRFDGPGWRLSLYPIEGFKRREVFRRTTNGWSSLMRRTEVRYAHLATPLWLEPGFSFDTTSPTHWSWRNFRTVGTSVRIHHPTKWNGIMANDLTVHGLRS